MLTFCAQKKKPKSSFNSKFFKKKVCYFNLSKFANEEEKNSFIIISNASHATASSSPSGCDLIMVISR